MTPYHFFYVYILKSIKNTEQFYIGFTTDLRKRFSQHNDNLVISTNDTALGNYYIMKRFLTKLQQE